MKPIVYGCCSFLFGVLLCGAGCVSGGLGHVETGDRESAPVALFNGVDLSGWRFHVEDPDVNVEDVWQVENGFLITTGRPLGYLYTEETFQDFRLRVEWRWPDGVEPSNSGVLLRMDETPRGFLTHCVEAQLRHGNAGDIIGFYGFEVACESDRFFERKHQALGHLMGVVKERDAEREPGEWNEYIISLRGDRLELTINGMKVNTAHGVTLARGPIGLQSEGGPIEFRTVEMIPLAMP